MKQPMPNSEIICPDNEIYNVMSYSCTCVIDHSCPCCTKCTKPCQNILMVKDNGIYTNDQTDIKCWGAPNTITSFPLLRQDVFDCRYNNNIKIFLVVVRMENLYYEHFGHFMINLYVPLLSVVNGIDTHKVLLMMNDGLKGKNLTFFQLMMNQIFNEVYYDLMSFPYKNVCLTNFHFGVSYYLSTYSMVVKNDMRKFYWNKAADLYRTAYNINLNLSNDNKMVVTYITRKDSPNRRNLLNEDTLLSFIKSHNPGLKLHIIDYSKMSKGEIINIYSITNILILIHGNGTPNIMFLPSSAMVIVLIPKIWEHHVVIWNQYRSFIESLGLLFEEWVSLSIPDCEVVEPGYVWGNCSNLIYDPIEFIIRFNYALSYYTSVRDLKI
jgi:hypothetical protein